MTFERRDAGRVARLNIPLPRLLDGFVDPRSLLQSLAAVQDWSRNVEARIDQAQAGIAALQEQLTGQSADLTALTAIVDGHTVDIAALTGDIATIQGDITTLQGDITTIQGDITTIQATLEDEVGESHLFVTAPGAGVNGGGAGLTDWILCGNFDPPAYATVAHVTMSMVCWLTSATTNPLDFRFNSRFNATLGVNNAYYSHRKASTTIPYESVTWADVITLPNTNAADLYVATRRIVGASGTVTTNTDTTVSGVIQFLA
jgi:hypothetical protein